MKTFRRPRASRRTHRGVALPFIALLLIVLLGMTALAVDLGILLGVRTEAQRTADAAALAGASVLLLDGQDEDGARDAAVDFAARNRVGGQVLTLDRDADVTVDLSRGYVGVRAERTTENGNPVQTRFARIIGFPVSNVSAWGAAVAGAGNAVRCPLPFALVDRFWRDSEDRLSFWDDAIDRANDTYIQGARTSNPPSPTQPTGWSNLDIGQAWRIYPERPNQTPTPGWYFPLAFGPGGNVYRDWISGCGDPDTQFVIGQNIDIEPGRMTGPTRQGFSNMLDGDNTRWSLAHGCPVASDDPDTCVGPSTTRRIRPILIISPMEDALTQSGRQSVEIVNLAGVYVICHGPLRAGVTPETVERRDQCSDPTGQDSPVWVRFMGIQGEIGQGGDPSSNSLVRVLRLVE